jgi:hypothetical protein
MPHEVETPATQATLQTQIAWDVLKELGEAERHFNNLETEYRKLASIWLLAGFAGIGFVLKSDPDLVVPREVAIAGIGLATSVGIFLLWIVDLLVYHRLLDACFTEAQKVEQQHPELPQVRTSMGLGHRGRVVTTRLRWFYVALTAAPIAFSIPIVVTWLLRDSRQSSAIMTVLAAIVYLALTSFLIWTKSLRTREA